MFLQKNSENSDSRTWREIVAVHDVINYGETTVFHPAVKLKPQNGFVNRGGDDDNLTLEQAMKKGLVPKDMKPAWSLEARKRYETCIAPDIEKYKKAVDKINRNADASHHEHTRDYLVTTFGVGSLVRAFYCCGE